MPASARRAVRVLLAAALLYGSGARWLAVQGAAWAGMFAARAGRVGAAAAAATTFDGRHPCRVCLAVRRGAGADAAPLLTRPAPTADFVFVSVPSAAVPGAAIAFAVPSALPPLAVFVAPPVPPPNASSAS